SSMPPNSSRPPSTPAPKPSSPSRNSPPGFHRCSAAAPDPLQATCSPGHPACKSVAASSSASRSVATGTKPVIRVLYADRADCDLDALGRLLGVVYDEFNVTTAPTLQELRERLSSDEYDLLLVDPDLAGCEEFDVIGAIEAVHPDLPVVSLSFDHGHDA